ncbi:MAG: NAD+ synthase [Bacteroidota bacterium]
MKIALAQLNYHIGNFSYNKKEIINTIIRAEQDYADLVVFSELCVCGYPPLDLLDYREFINQCDTTVNEIAEHCVGIAAIIGAPRVNPNPSGKMLLNSAFFLHDGKVQHIQDKTLLPTYDIFDEYRYFEPNERFEIIQFKGKRIALTVCEDLWDEQPAQGVFSRNRLYNKSPMEKLRESDPDMLINIAASPFSYSKIWGKKNIFIQKAKRYNMPVFYVNQVGAQTELIFEGASLAIHPNGIIHKELKWFEQDFQVVDVDEVSKKIDDHETHDTYGVIAKIHDALILGLRDFFNKLNFKKAVLGLSGGIDSAVSLVIAQRAIGNENLRVMLMPSDYTSENSVSDSKKLADNLQIHYDEIPIQEILHSFTSALEPAFRNMPEDVTEENLQARIRGTLLMAISNKFGHILLNTSNKSESSVGYATLYGDMTGALSVLGDVYKTDVYRLAEYINREEEIIPNNIMQKAPSAELRPNQKDSDALPQYELLDKILFQYIELQKSSSEIIEEGFDEETVRKIVYMVNANEYKRYQAPPVLRISSKAFGVGRRMPLVAKY